MTEPGVRLPRVEVLERGQDHLIVRVCVTDLYWFSPTWQALKEEFVDRSWLSATPTHSGDSFQPVWWDNEKFQCLLMTRKPEPTKLKSA